MAESRNRHSPLCLQLAPHPNQYRNLPLRRISTCRYPRRSHRSSGLAHTARRHHSPGHLAGFYFHHRCVGTQYLWIHWHRRCHHSICDLLFWSADEDEEPVYGFQCCGGQRDDGRYGNVWHACNAAIGGRTASSHIILIAAQST